MKNNKTALAVKKLADIMADLANGTISVFGLHQPKKCKKPDSANKK